jgi:putative flavoprotein involved in K+ transport
MNIEQTDAVVVGAGHAGLAMSYCLTQLGVNHFVLERGVMAERWRSERWDSLTLLTPNWMTQLPGFRYSGTEPDGFVGRDEYRAFLEQYAQSFDAPVRTGENVRSLSRDEVTGQYHLDTSAGAIQASSVVIATGPFHVPAIPTCSTEVPQTITQLHTSAYRNPHQLPAGAVLVVGSGNSGAQIAEELVTAGRRVYLSTGHVRHAPRRYRGHDLMWWFVQLGVLDRTTDQVTSPDVRNAPPPMLTGVGGGHDLNLHRLADRGVTLLGRIQGVTDGIATVDRGVRDTLIKADEALVAFKSQIDDYIIQHGITVPHDGSGGTALPIESDEDGITMLDLQGAGITSIIWATGFRSDYGWVHLSVFDQSGEPEHHGGVTRVPGLYFLGLRWLSKYKSFFIYGVGEDAQRLARHIADRPQ